MSRIGPNDGKPGHADAPSDQEIDKKEEPLHPERVSREKVEKNVPADRDPDDPVSP